jgi:serine/threonine protein kinase
VDEMDGTPFGHYRLIELLGRGGMGEVWRAYDTETKRIVAIKVLPSFLADDNEFVQRFRREAEAAARLNSPHVIPIHRYGEIDGSLYVDMRLIEGSDLQTVLTQGPLEPARAVRIIEGVALALHAAHQVGLLHRDVKPSNILLDRDDFAYLIDFGIARTADETRLTKSGNTIGTFAYIAPERLDGSGEEDARVDIYSLACVLYETLTGDPPFAGDTTPRLINAHVNTPPPRPSSTQPNVPPQVDEVIATGMAKDPDQRYSTTVELADAAHDAITTPLAPSGKPTRLHNQTRPPSAPAAPQQPTEPTEPPPHQDAPPQPAIDTPPPTRSKRKWLIAAAVVLLVAAVGAGVALTRVLSPKTSTEVVLTGSTDPGANAFMPPAATPPPANTQPPPTLQPQGNGTTVETQPLPGNRDGLYGGTMNNAECERDKMISFLSAHPAQASAFVDALNTDPDLHWSGGHPLTAADIPSYLRELTPTVLRLDTRVTNHGFDGTHPTALQSVFQAGTAVLVDANGVPRSRCYCGNPLTAPAALTGEAQTVGTPWPGYHPGGLAAVQPSSAAITNFVLVDVVTGRAFNRPAGTTGANDTPHSQPITSSQPAPTTSTTGQTPALDIDGTYLWHTNAGPCGGDHAATATITHQGNTLTLVSEGFTHTGTLNADGSFTLSGHGETLRGVFVTEDGRTVIRDGTFQSSFCNATFAATKQ